MREPLPCMDALIKAYMNVLDFVQGGNFNVDLQASVTAVVRNSSIIQGHFNQMIYVSQSRESDNKSMIKGAYKILEQWADNDMHRIQDKKIVRPYAENQTSLTEFFTHVVSFLEACARYDSYVEVELQGTQKLPFDRD